MSVKERLKRFIYSTGSNVRAFETYIGLSNGYVNNIKKSISQETLVKISSKFGQLNTTWLLLGEGEMLKIDPRSNSTSKNRVREAEEIGYLTGEDVVVTEKSGNDFIDTEQGDSYMGVPLVEYQAYAGYLGGWNDPEYIEDLPKHWINVDKRYRGLYRAFVVRGNSMNDGTLDSIIDGDIVTCRLIEKDLWSSKFHMHQYSNFVIVHKDGILVKELKGHEVGNGKILVKSRNPDKGNYPDQELDLKDVYEILNVLETSRKLKMK